MPIMINLKKLLAYNIDTSINGENCFLLIKNRNKNTALATAISAEPQKKLRPNLVFRRKAIAEPMNTNRN